MNFEQGALGFNVAVFVLAMAYLLWAVDRTESRPFCDGATVGFQMGFIGGLSLVSIFLFGAAVFG